MVASGQIKCFDGYKSPTEAAIARDVALLHLYGREPPHSFVENKE
jgi:hypothetical protein